MTPVSTVMRAAFEKAIAKLPKKKTVHGPTDAVAAMCQASTRNNVSVALRRKVGLVNRKTMWSIQRGNR